MALKKPFLIILILFLSTFYIERVNGIIVYDFDTLEDLNSLTKNNSDNYNVTLNVDSKMGSYSFNYCNNSAMSGDSHDFLNTVTVCPSGTKVLGFWFKALGGQSSSDAINTVRWVDTDNDHSIFLGVHYNTDHSAFRFYCGVLGSGGFPTHSHPLTLDKWYWVELRWVNSNTQQIVIDGVDLHDYSGWNVQIDDSNVQVHIARFSYTYLLKARYDYFRITDTLEYPPSNPKSKLEVDTRNLSNQTLNIPFVLNTSSFNCPYNESLDQASYIMEALGQWNNKTHIYTFVNWSDGSTNLIRTFTLDEDKSFIVYYTIGVKYDPGGWINFGIGLVGLILIFLSWIVLKLKWKDHDYSSAIGYWLLLMVIGIALFTVMVGG